MSAKDRYGNNLRRNDEVSHAHETGRRGTVVGTDGQSVLVRWEEEGTEEERIRGADLILASQRFGGRRSR